MKKKVLFLCTHNSARSQMAEGLMNHYLGDRYIAKSAGVETSKVNPFAILAMKELGIDISHHYSKHLNEFLGEEFDFIITVCDHAKEHCPYFSGGKTYIHKSFEDPSSIEGEDNEKIKAFRRIRDEIKDWLIENFKDKKGLKLENIGQIFTVNP